jgi:hypothetical protein
MRPLSVKNNLRRGLEYVTFWCVSMVILASHFSYGETIERIDWIYSLLFHLSLMFAVVLNSFILIPRFLARKRYGTFVVLFVIVLTLGTFLNQFTFTHLADYLFPGYFFISYFEWNDILLYVVVYLGVTSLLQFSRSWFQEAESRRTLAELRKVQTEQELRSLRSHVQPHFLFNSLNTLYALIKSKSSKAEEAVLTLSELLRYTIRHSESDRVTLSDEISYLSQYIALQKLRTDYPDHVELLVEADDVDMQNIQVVPLLFLPFVENAFKYGDGDVRVQLHVSGEEVVFLCRNRVSGGNDLVAPGNGTGIVNVRKRLDLVYPGTHELHLHTIDGYFEVTLKLSSLMSYRGDVE